MSDYPIDEKAFQEFSDRWKIRERKTALEKEYMKNYTNELQDMSSIEQQLCADLLKSKEKKRNIIKLEEEIAKIRVEIDNEKQDLYRLSNQIVPNCQQLADGKKQYVKWCEFQDWFKLDTDN